jgi:large subunit ribosomal protein L17
MRKNIFGRQFSRDTNERKSLFKSLINSLILEESIETTLEKAKAIKGDVDNIINKAKKGNERLAIQLLQRSLGAQAMDKVIKDLALRLNDRTSGYTRIIRLGRRFSDNAQMVVMGWVVKPEIKNEKLKMKNDVKELPEGKKKEKVKEKKDQSKKEEIKKVKEREKKK